MPIDPQDPLPESKWLWRRVLVFSLTILFSVAVGFVLWTLHVVALEKNDNALQRLYDLAWLLLVIGLIDRVLYLVAPSAETITKWLATVSAWKGATSLFHHPAPPPDDGELPESERIQ